MEMILIQYSKRLLSVFFLTLFSLPALSCRAEEAYPDLLSIGEVRGEVPPADDASKFRARLNQETVVVRGLVHQILRWRTMKGKDAYGMLIQNLPDDADASADSSDGLFVYLGDAPLLPLHPQGDYEAKVGDLVTLRGMVNERYGQTEFSDASALAVKSGLDVDSLLPPVELSLPAAFSERQRVLEKLEGMRVRLPARAVAVSGLHPQYRTWDTQVWVIPPTHPAALRQNPSARRRYRPAHPLSTVTEALKNDGNGDFLIVGSLGLVERLADRDQRLPPIYAGMVFAKPVVGGIHYTWNEYVLQADTLPAFEPFNPTPANLPEVDPAAGRVRVAAYNVENLYDFVNDPYDNCDFQGDVGCPGSRFPLNYVPASDDIFKARVAKIADQIVNELHAPDILMIQEAEDQDLARMVNGVMIYGEKNDGDGQTDALQEVALQIFALGGPKYRVMVDRDGADDRGIVCAWMVKADKFRALPPESVPEVFGSEPALPASRQWLPLCKDVSNPKAFNAVFTGTPDNASELVTVFSRSVQVLLLEEIASGKRLWLQNNHFSAGPNRYVERRTAQAAVNAELSQLIRKLDPQAILLMGGDLNVFPRPDDPLDPPSDQLAPLYDAGMFNVMDRIMLDDPARAYSYIFNGVAGTLDHFFLSETAKQKLTFAAYLKLNAGSPEAFPEFPPLRASDHDPLLIELAW